MLKARILRLTNGTLDPISEDDFKMFLPDYFRTLENSIVPVWGADTPSAQDTFIKSVWEVLEQNLHFRTNYRTNANEEYSKPNDDFYLIPIGGDLDYFNVRLIMPFFKTWYELYYRKPGPIATSYFYMGIFPWQLWVYEILFLAALPVIFWTTCYIYKYFSLKKVQLRLSDCFMHVMSVISNQGSYTAASTGSIRFLTLVVMIFGFLVTVFYAALLVANQAVSIEAPEFTTLGQLRRVGTHQLCIDKESWALTKFLEDPYAEDEQVLDKWEKLLNGPRCPADYDNYLPATCHKQIVSLVLFKHFTHNNGIRFGHCLVVPFKKRYFSDMALLTVGRRFPHTRTINLEISKMRDSGILQYLWMRCRKYIPPIETPPPEAPSVSYSHIEGVIGVYILCIIFSVLLLLIEVLIKLLIYCCGRIQTYRSRVEYFQDDSGPNAIPYYN